MNVMTHGKYEDNEDMRTLSTIKTMVTMTLREHPERVILEICDL